MNILITGGAGFIGSHTADALIAEGHCVRILDSLHQSVHPHGKPAYLNPQAEFLRGDVRDKTTWQKGLEQIEAVYHFAAYQDYLPDFSTFFHVNAVSTALMYEILVEKKLTGRIKKIIVASSQAVMGEGRYKCFACSETENICFYPQIRTETQLAAGDWEHHCPRCHAALHWMPSDETIRNPCNQYALSKHSQEQIAMQLGRRYCIPTVVMRYSIVQGPRQSFHNAYSGVMRIFALSLFFDRRPIIFEDGRQIRDYVNIEDVVAANLLVLEKEAADYQVFNVGGAKAWTVNAFYGTMQHVLGKSRDPVISNYYRFGDTRHIFSDIKRIASLGWSPVRGIEDSIKAYWAYLQQQTHLDDVLDFAQANMQQLQVIRKIQE